MAEAVPGDQVERVRAHLRRQLRRGGDQGGGWEGRAVIGGISSLVLHVVRIVR